MQTFQAGDVFSGTFARSAAQCMRTSVRVRQSPGKRFSRFRNKGSRCLDSSKLQCPRDVTAGNRTVGKPIPSVRNQTSRTGTYLGRTFRGSSSSSDGHSPVLADLTAFAVHGWRSNSGAPSNPQQIRCDNLYHSMRNLLTKAEAAKAAKVSVRTLENWMQNGLISYVKIGGIVRIPEEQLEQLQERYLIQGRNARTKGSASSR